MINHRHRLWLGLCLGIFAQAWPAQGQTTKTSVRTQPIADAVKTGTSAPPRAVIDPFVKGEAANLANSDPKVQRTARQNLIDGAAAVRPGVASPAYLDVYSASVNDALLPLAKNTDIGVRLNAAVALQGVAARGGTARLAPAVTAFLNDKLEAIALWGVKAAKYIIPAQIDAKNGALAAAVVSAVRSFPDSVPILEEAYDDLVGDAIKAGGLMRMGAIMPHVLALMQLRANIYDAALAGGGAVLPASPQSDNAALVFVSATAWNAATPQQKQQIGRAVVDLMTKAAKLAENAPRGAAGGAAGREDLVSLLKFVGSSAVVVGQNTKNDAIRNAATALNKLGNDPAQDDLIKMSEALEGAMKAANLVGPAPGPARGPTTSTATRTR